MRKTALQNIGVFLALIALLITAPLLAGPGSDLSDDTVVASSQGVTVTLGDLKAFIEQVRLERKVKSQPNQDTLLGIAEQILLQRALAQEAEREGMDRDPAVVRRLRLKREELLARSRVQELVDQAEFPDLEQIAEETYLTNRDHYTRPEQVRAAHILIGVKERSDEEARELAERLRAELDAHPERFAELAREHSDDPGSAEKGGDLGWFARNRMVKPFADAAFAMNSPGELSPVVRSKFGYHIIRFDERRAGAPIPFAEVKPEIVEQEKANHRKRLRREYTNKIVTAPDLEYNHGVMEAYARSLHPIPVGGR